MSGNLAIGRRRLRAPWWRVRDQNGWLDAEIRDRQRSAFNAQGGRIDAVAECKVAGGSSERNMSERCPAMCDLTTA